MVFLSTLSLRRATTRQMPLTRFYPDFYPRSPCGERPFKISKNLTDRKYFYPRSPCGERLDSSRAANCQHHFYPRSPCGERRLAHDTYVIMEAFLSTLSLRRATGRHRGNDRCPINFYPRSPCGERLKPPVQAHREKHFYPRSPCGERHQKNLNP